MRISRAWTQWLQDIDKLLELLNYSQWPLEILKRCSKAQRPANEDIAVIKGAQSRYLSYFEHRQSYR